MNDLISRDEAIDAIYEHQFGNWCDKDEVCTVLNDLPSAQPKSRWIPCSERLPHSEYGESDNVLTTCCLRDDEGYRFVRTLYYNGGGIWCYPTGETFENRVRAWMPIPKPYGKGDENE